MSGFLSRYFAFIWLITLILPLWAPALSTRPLSVEAFRGPIFGSLFLAAVFWLIKSRPRFQVRGNWRDPDRFELKLFSICSLAAVAIDYGSKLLFFRTDRTDRMEIFPGFGLRSIFHDSEFEVHHAYVLLFIFVPFFFGGLFFRFSTKTLDRIWLISASLTLGATVALSLERLIFGGVHNSFYLSGPLRWLCPNCAIQHPGGFAWTPADFFLNASLLPVFVFIVSYVWPVRSKD